MASKMHGVHTTAQTAFRLPEGLLAWVREQAKREGDGRTMTDIAVRALEAERERCAGITTSATPAAPVSPPRRTRKPRADTAPAATFKQPEQPPQRAHTLTCKCGICKSGGK